MNKLFLTLWAAFSVVCASAQNISDDLLDEAHDCFANNMYEFGSVYLRGTLSQEYLEESISWYETVADDKSVEVATTIGKICFTQGEDKFSLIEKKHGSDAAFRQTREYYEEAFSYFFVPAILGYPEASYYLGLLYEKGTPVKKDMKKAFFYYYAASEKGYPLSYYHTGLCFKNGIGVLENVHAAYSCFEKGGDAGDERCRRMATIDAVFFDNDKVMVNESKFFKWSSELYEHDENDRTLYLMGFCYYNGIGCTSDYAGAVRFWKKAAGRKNFAIGTGSFRALCSLAECYREGKGVSRNEDTADQIERRLDCFTGSMYGEEDRQKAEKYIINLLGI